MGAGLGFFESILHELTVVGISALPILELKAAIPVGLAFGIPLWRTFILALIGSILPVPILLLFLKPVMNFLKSTKLFHKFAHWVEQRSLKKSTGVQKYSLLGLFIFVAIPLPTTGVWTGSVIASLLGLRVRDSFIAIAVGNLIAGLLILLLSYRIF